MSTFELYHIQGIRQYRTTEIFREKNHKINIKAVRKTNSLRCSQCGAVEVTTKGWKERVFIGVPSGLLKTEIHLGFTVIIVVVSGKFTWNLRMVMYDIHGISHVMRRCF